MAAIAGLINGDPDRSVERSAVEAMLQRLVVYPERSMGLWTAGAVHLSCADPPSAELRDIERLKIVADVRLDDRPALASALGLDATWVSDVELIRHAYEKWGYDCPRHLTGDFAFAIWDEARRQLFCARDQLGVRPFHYRCDREGFAFASRLNTIARPGDRFSKSRIAGYLAGIDDSHEETIFDNIHRLPMGHWLAWSPGQLRIERYFGLTAEAVAPNEDFVQGFRQRFLAAVDDRSLGATDVGAMLSGGLDSSSIVSAVAHRQGRNAPPLRTFSFSYPPASPYDESEYGTAVLEKYRLTPAFVDMDDVAPLDGLADLADGMDDLFFAPGLPKIARLLASARKSGVRIMLDGHGGDEVVSLGFGRLAELARERRWATLYRELRGVSAVSGESAVGLLLQFYLGQGLIARARKWVGRRAGSPSGDAGRASSLLDPALVRETDLDERITQWSTGYRRAVGSEAALHHWNMSSAAVARAFETLHRAGDQVGVELRFPFYDRRLVTYALAIPDREKLRDGWPRSVLRRAMAGILPAKVQWRRGKVDFGPELAAGLVRHHGDLLREVLRDDAAVGEYVDLSMARRHVKALLVAPGAANPLDLFALWRVVFLALWLNNRSAALRPEKVLS